MENGFNFVAKNLALAGVISVLLIACSRKEDTPSNLEASPAPVLSSGNSFESDEAPAGLKAPKDAVVDGTLTIYAKYETQDPLQGKYVYWVRDGSSYGWRFITDQELTIGDTLQITVARSKVAQLAQQQIMIPAPASVPSRTASGARRK